MIDYHTHHERCGHAAGTLQDYIEKAIELGIKQLGLSDHSPYYFMEGNHPMPGLAMPKDEFPKYVKEMLSLREAYKDKIDIRLGVESDYIPGLEDMYRNIFAQYPFDYIIGSVHVFDGFHVYNHGRFKQPESDVDQVYIRYFQHVQMSARSGLFDIIGHMDALKAMKQQPTIALSPLIEQTLKVLKASDVAIEINTSGIRKKSQEVFPSPEIIEQVHHLDIPITYGSDCHQIDELAFEWDYVRKLLLSIGVKQIATFKERRRDLIAL